MSWRRQAETYDATARLVKDAKTDFAKDFELGAQLGKYRTSRVAEYISILYSHLILNSIGRHYRWRRLRNHDEFTAS